MPDRNTPKYELSVEGSPIPPEALESVIAITCRQDLTMADTVEVKLSNGDLHWTEGDLFAEGKKLSVKLGYNETDIQLIATGEIVRRECEFPERGPAVLNVVALDKEFRLKHGKKSRSFKDVKDSDVVSQLCGDAGLSADVDDTQVTHKYLFQVNQTNLEFIRERARRLGYIVQVDRENAKLAFKKPKVGDPKVVTLTWGRDLLMFRPRFSIDEQGVETSVRAYDLTQKKAIVAKSAPKKAVSSMMGVSRLGDDLARKKFAKRDVLYPQMPVISTQEAQQMADAYQNAILQRYVQGEGSCLGTNTLVPGVVIEVAGCGKRANGNYYVINTFHHYTPKGYATFFSFIRPSDTAAPVPPPPPPPPIPPPPPGPEPETSVTMVVTGGEGVDITSLDYTLKTPDGKTKSGKLDSTGRVKVEGIKKPGDAEFEIRTPPDLTAIDPSRRSGGAGGGGGGGP